MFTLLAAFIAFHAPALPSQSPIPVSAAIEEVTVYPGKALVRRRARLPAPSGEVLISGLTWVMEPDSLRVRISSGEVVAVELRERRGDSAGSERVKELRQRLQVLEREMRELRDTRDVLKTLEDHLEHLLTFDDRPREKDAGDSVETWRANMTFIAAELAKNATEQRQNDWKIEEKQLQIDNVQAELGRDESAGGVPMRDALVSFVGAAGQADLDLEYVVQNAGWQPVYDLRAASDVSAVELSYRARVWQETGEDWSDMQLALSTAQPMLGAQGPDPELVRLHLYDPKSRGDLGVAARVASRSEGPQDFSARRVAGSADDAPQEAGEPHFASVESQGISAHFRLPRPETVESRPQPTTVLVSRAKLEVRPEYHCVPSQNELVWLRGVTKNTSEWSLLPGTAAVYFGSDFVGNAALDTVRPGEEFTLHLGPDPAISVERTKIEDLTKNPGVFGNRVAVLEAWRVHLENHGSAVAGAGGEARVFLRETLPTAADNRVSVSLERAEPQVSGDERWKKDREEKGVLTWEVRIARGGETDVTYQTKISYPEGFAIQRTRE